MTPLRKKGRVDGAAPNFPARKMYGKKMLYWSTKQKNGIAQVLLNPILGHPRHHLAAELAAVLHLLPMLLLLLLLPLVIAGCTGCTAPLAGCFFVPACALLPNREFLLTSICFWGSPVLRHEGSRGAKRATGGSMLHPAKACLACLHFLANHALYM